MSLHVYVLCFHRHTFCVYIDGGLPLHVFLGVAIFRSLIASPLCSSMSTSNEACKDEAPWSDDLIEIPLGCKDESPLSDDWLPDDWIEMPCGVNGALQNSCEELIRLTTRADSIGDEER